MKLCVIVMCLGSCAICSAQINIVPYAGFHSTKLQIFQSLNNYVNGGTSVIAGVELEWKRRATLRQRLTLGAVTGIGYVDNGFRYFENNSYTDQFGDSFDYTALDIQSESLQVPASVRFYWRPFPLIEDYNIFFGVGAINNLRWRAAISEEHTMIKNTSSVDLPASNVQPEADQVIHFGYDWIDASNLGGKYSLYGRLEVGMAFRRIQVAFRLSRSLTDVYFKGLENQPEYRRALAEYWSGQDGPQRYYLYPSRYVLVDSNFQPAVKKELWSEFAIGFRLMK